MVFAYYRNLSKANRAIYRMSDSIETLSISHPELLYDKIFMLQKALANEEQVQLKTIATHLMNGIAQDIKAPPLTIRVLASRPNNDAEELHGLYEPVSKGKKARITVWMRTARHKKVVAFRSFLRTLLHELCHHIDYELFHLEDSYHTEGFFKRESDIFKQLLNEKNQ